MKKLFLQIIVLTMAIYACAEYLYLGPGGAVTQVPRFWQLYATAFYADNFYRQAGAGYIWVNDDLKMIPGKKFIGDVTGKADTAGNADTVTTNANLTGDITSVGNATTIKNNPTINNPAIVGANTVWSSHYTGTFGRWSMAGPLAAPTDAFWLYCFSDYSDNSYDYKSYFTQTCGTTAYNYFMVFDAGRVGIGKGAGNAVADASTALTIKASTADGSTDIIHFNDSTGATVADIDSNGTITSPAFSGTLYGGSTYSSQVYPRSQDAYAETVTPANTPYGINCWFGSSTAGTGEWPYTYQSVLSFKTYSGNTTGGGGSLQIIVPYDDGYSNDISFRIGDYNGASPIWKAYRTFIDSGNYNSYAPKLDGTGATGTWPINITGTAAHCSGESATVATAKESTDTTCYPLFGTGQTGNQSPKSSDYLTFNSNTGSLYSSIISTPQVDCTGKVTGAKFKHTQISAALTDNTPTDAEIDSATGTTPAGVGAGWKCTIKDSNGTGLLYAVESDGTNWYYKAYVKAL
jgi:hypothetical protein